MPLNVCGHIPTTSMNCAASFGRLAYLPCRGRAVCLHPSHKFSTARDSSSLKTRRTARTSWSRLPDAPARTRFAPSPTGYLHLGSLRTALYNYLLARATNGQFVLRLEDTDQSRIVPDAETRLYEDLTWTGLSWDEGPDCGGPSGPYKQSQRLWIYKEYADRLLMEGKAFRCFCSHEHIAAHHQRTAAVDGIPGTYPGRCLSISPDESAERAAKGEAHTIRFRSSPIPVPVHDVVYGIYRKKLPEDHFIIMKSDGFPTYHFANVVDDHLMDITHVVRGAEWLISTAKHVSLYDAFGWEPPHFAHVGLLVDSNRQKLSKRNMDIGIDSYKRDGIPPPALLNFAALLGWNPRNSSAKGVMTLDDMIQSFDMKFTKGDIVVNTEKLFFFHKKHVRLALDNPSPAGNRMLDEYIAGPVLRKASEIETRRQGLPEIISDDPMLQEFLTSLGEPIMHIPSPEDSSHNEAALRQARSMIKLSRGETTSASAVIEKNRFLIWEPSIRYIRNSYPRLLDALGRVFVGKNESNVPEVLHFFIEKLNKVDGTAWAVGGASDALENTVKHVVRHEEGGNSVIMGYRYLRWALLGLDDGPQISLLMEYLGKTETIRRLALAQSVSRSASFPGLDEQGGGRPECRVCCQI